MRYLLPLFLALLVSGCMRQPEARIGLYAYNMMYACDGPRYRIFRVTAPQLELTGQAQALTLQDEDTVMALDRALAGPTDMDDLIGHDLDLEFADPATEKAFEDAMGQAAICYLYYLEGRYPGRHRFLVEDYRLTEKVPGCIGDPADDSERL